jgi:hypothetical protein
LFFKIKNMKKLHYIFIILMSIVSFFTLQSVNNNQSGDKAWNSCAGGGCHNSSTATTLADISLLDNTTPVFEYEGGKTYKIIMTGNNISLNKFGFQLRETNNKGTFSGFPANVGKQALGYITHSSQLSKTNFIFSVEMTWTAPAAGSGTVSFDALINAVNGNGNNSGDAVSAVKTTTYNEKVTTTFALTCASISNIGNLVSGSAASGVSFSVPYTGATSGASYSAVNASSTGVTGLTASLSAGSFSGTSGNLTFNISGTPSGTGNASFNFTVNGASCTHVVSVSAANSFALTCANATTTGTLTKNIAASGASFTLPYTGATSGSAYSAVNVSSTGVLGLTASLSAGTFSATAGNLTLNITGTPTSSGTASFLVNIAGKTCTLTKTVAVGSSIISNVSNPLKIHFQNNILSIEGDQAHQIQSISAFDLNGRNVYNQEINTQANKLLINNFNLNKGMYVLKIQKSNGESLTKKLMIQ